MPVFSHLHVHTQYSLLDGAASIKSLVKKAKADGMPALAITDHGNMFGAFEFYQAVTKEGLLPVIGWGIKVRACEFFCPAARLSLQQMSLRFCGLHSIVCILPFE